MIALVTGASGFLGSRVCQALLDEGWEVRGVSRRSPQGLVSRPGFVWIGRDLSKERLSSGETAGVDALFHAAGANGGAGSSEELFLDANERLLLNTLNACPEVPRVVHASSQVVYGDAGGLALREDQPLVADSAYAASKINSESWLRAHQARRGCVAVILRLTGFIEGGGAVTTFFEKARRGEAIEVLGGGQVRRDYLAVDDGARAFVLAASRAFPRPAFEAYNIGSGVGLTTLELARLAVELTGSSSAVVPVSKPAPRRDCVLDISKARRELGFAPRPLAQAVRAFA